MTKSQAANNPVKLNEEGELVGGKFCEYCGGLNPTDAAECEHCHEHIADQGPDLDSRLQRIHRHASSSDGFRDIADGGIGSVPYERHERDEQPFRLSPGVILAGSLFVLFLAALFIPPYGSSNPITLVIGFFAVVSFYAIAAAILDGKSR